MAAVCLQYGQCSLVHSACNGNAHQSPHLLLTTVLVVHLTKHSLPTVPEIMQPMLLCCTMDGTYQVTVPAVFVESLWSVFSSLHDRGQQVPSSSSGGVLPHYMWGLHMSATNTPFQPPTTPTSTPATSSSPFTFLHMC